jgi:hypothetical protein
MIARIQSFAQAKRSSMVQINLVIRNQISEILPSIFSLKSPSEKEEAEDTKSSCIDEGP